MRRRQVLRESRLAHVAVGVSMLAIPASAAAALVGKTAIAAPAKAAPASGGVGPQRAVARRVHVRRRAISTLSGDAVNVRGRLVPAAPWRRVRLEGLRGGHWLTLSSTQTRTHGGFSVRYVAHDPGSERLRVVVGGGRGTPAVHAGAGTLTVYRESVASWYQDGGGTACGFHAHYGVANRTLPCGSRITFVRGGRTVNAVVDDRGPYVSGRDWDLNQNTAGALAFDGVGTVWSSA
jgi:rare lipoprotein A